MKEYCHIFSVEPSGWCFFDCVVNQVNKHGNGEMLTRLGVAALSLEEPLRFIRKNSLKANRFVMKSGIGTKSRPARVCWFQ